MWYMGQKVVALQGDGITDHLKKGTTYTVRAITTCKCGINLDIGINSDDTIWCHDCQVYHPKIGARWFFHEFFAPATILLEQDNTNELK